MSAGAAAVGRARIPRASPRLHAAARIAGAAHLPLDRVLPLRGVVLRVGALHGEAVRRSVLDRLPRGQLHLLLARGRRRARRARVRAARGGAGDLARDEGALLVQLGLSLGNRVQPDREMLLEGRQSRQGLRQVQEVLSSERKSLSRRTIRGRFSMMLTTVALVAFCRYQNDYFDARNLRINRETSSLRSNCLNLL